MKNGISKYLVESSIIPRLSLYLNRFKQTSNDTWNFRCPVCGDSKKNDYIALHTPAMAMCPGMCHSL